MSWNVGTVRDPKGIVHIWYCCSIGTFDEDCVVCRPDGSWFIPIAGMNTPSGWTYCKKRVTCRRCMGEGLVTPDDEMLLATIIAELHEAMSWSPTLDWIDDLAARYASGGHDV